VLRVMGPMFVRVWDGLTSRAADALRTRLTTPAVYLGRE
jgi:hypothetical protein